MDAVAGLDRHGAGLALLEAHQEGLELRHGAAARDLAEAAALAARRAVGQRAGELGEALGRGGKLLQRGLGARLGRGPRLGVVGRRREQDVLRIEQVGRAEARLVGIVVAPALVLACLGRAHLALDQARDHGFLGQDVVIGRVIGRVIGHGAGRGGEPDPRRLLQQQLAHHQGVGRLAHRRGRRRGRMVLHLGMDRVAADLHAIHPDAHGCLAAVRPTARPLPRARTTW